MLTVCAASLAVSTGLLRVRIEVEKRAVATGTVKRVVARGVLAVLRRNDIVYGLSTKVSSSC